MNVCWLTEWSHPLDILHYYMSMAFLLPSYKVRDSGHVHNVTMAS